MWKKALPNDFMSSGPLVRVSFHSLVQGAFGISYIVFRVQGMFGHLIKLKINGFLRNISKFLHSFVRSFVSVGNEFMFERKIYLSDLRLVRSKRETAQWIA